MEIALTYELPNSLDLANSNLKNQHRSAIPNSNLTSPKSTFYVNENKDKNNNYNNSSTKSIESSKSTSQINRDPYYNDFELDKVYKKLEKENKNSKNFAMKLISMQSINHNVDLVIHSYNEKV